MSETKSIEWIPAKTKPVEVQALRFTTALADTLNGSVAYADVGIIVYRSAGIWKIRAAGTDDPLIPVKDGDWIIRSPITRRFFVLDPTSFHRGYEAPPTLTQQP